MLRDKCSGEDGCGMNIRRDPDGGISCRQCGWKRIARLIGSCGETVKEFPYNGAKRWVLPCLDGEHRRAFDRGQGVDSLRIHEYNKQQIAVIFREVLPKPVPFGNESVQAIKEDTDAFTKPAGFKGTWQQAIAAGREARESDVAKEQGIAPKRALRRREPMVVRYSEED